MARTPSAGREGSSTSASRKASPTASRTSTAETPASRTDRERSIEPHREESFPRPYGAQTPHRAAGGAGQSPFSIMRRVADDFDRLFQDFGLGGSMLASGLRGGLWNESGGLTTSQWAPQIETFRRGDSLVVRADLPGLHKEDVHVEVDDGVLTISGERANEHEEHADGSYRTERSYGSFYRAIPIPEGVDASQCDAWFKDGVLEVTLPAPSESPRQGREVRVR